MTRVLRLYLSTEGEFADVRVLADLARDAEEAGWDGVFMWDELLPIFEHSDPVRAALGESGDVADSLVALTAVAAATSRIRFGAMVTPVVRLRPELFARQTATLDCQPDDPFDVVIGNAAGTLPANDRLADYSDVGVTWLLVQALTLEEARDRLSQGPPPQPER